MTVTVDDPPNGKEKDAEKKEEEEQEICSASEHHDKFVPQDYLEGSFDWTEVCKWIANIEATMETPQQMQDKARSKMRAVLEVNVHETPVVRNVAWKVDDSIQVPAKFQVVTTVFCLEYSCETLEGYMRAVKSACSLIEDGGYLIQGGVLEATTYSFGGTRFKCHYLKKSHIIESLKQNGMAHENEHFKFITHDEIFLLVSKKVGSK
ncbi:hypothetical protein WR25_10799 [Diploscapter pachys]|uniref:Methyltransferase type 11 domain-containing protein n=1 Tax=Diploscapter pachys TaxID=2018661 RepID=A0A2A2JBX6_9BILA|nr:hypothetical protein WR25_10799 [Diploscapter pachys]